MAKKKEDELQEVLDRAVGTGVSAGQNLGAYKNANGQTTTYRPEFAGQTVQMGNQYVTYNEKGYPTQATSVNHAKKLGNDYTKQYMGLDQNNTANAGDVYRALYNQSMSGGANAAGNLANAFGKRNIQYDSTLGRSDYEALIQNAASKGNNVLAGFYEDSLNALLNNLGMGSQMSSTYNGGWNYVDNGGGVGNIYAGALRDPVQTDQAFGGGWVIGQGKGDPAEEYFYQNNDMPSMQEVIAYAKMKGYNTDDENVMIPIGELSREMIANGYVAPKTQNAANSLNVALPAVLNNLGLEVGDNLGTDALNAAIASMRQGNGGGDVFTDETIATLYNMAQAATAADTPSAPYSGGASLFGNGSANFGGYGNYGGGAARNIANQLMGMRYDDWARGSEYANLADRYSNQGRAAMQNVLGQISSRTGGLASSYAATAANQQYNDFMSALEEVARQMYANERGDLMDNFNMMRTLENDEYARQQDAYERDYRAQQDAYERQQAAQDDAFSRQMAAAELMASIGDYSGYKALGLTDEQIAALGANYAAKNQPRVITDPVGDVVDDDVEEVYTTPSGIRPSMTDFYYNPMQGYATWNGRKFTSTEELQEAINNADLTEDEEFLLTMQLRFNGF